MTTTVEQRKRKGDGSRWRRPVLMALFLAATFAIGPLHARNDAQDRGRGGDRDDDSRGQYAIGLWGDVPYSDTQATVGVPNLIADMNRAHLAFSVHDGDLKTGNGAPICDDALYTRSLGELQHTAVARDVHARRQRLDRLRPTQQRRLQLARTADARAAGDVRHAVFVRPAPTAPGRADHAALPRRRGCRVPDESAAGCVENRRWTVGGVTYVTLNIQGSCNNLCGDGRRPAGVRCP